MLKIKIHPVVKIIWLVLGITVGLGVAIISLKQDDSYALPAPMFFLFLLWRFALVGSL